MNKTKIYEAPSFEELSALNDQMICASTGASVDKLIEDENFNW